MTDNTRMVDLPWHDGTTRTVPEGTAYVGRDGYLAFAREGGYSFKRTAGNPFNHSAESAAVLIFTEAPEPPVKVDVPTGLGAIVSGRWAPDIPVFILGRHGWCGLNLNCQYEASAIAEVLRNGGRVLYEGVDE